MVAHHVSAAIGTHAITVGVLWAGDVEELEALLNCFCAGVVVQCVHVADVCVFG